MTFTSTMAQAWITFRLGLVSKANSESDLDTIYSAGLADLNRLREFDLIDADEYSASLTHLQNDIKDQRTFLRAMGTV